MDFTVTDAQRDLAALTAEIAGKLVTPERLRDLDKAPDRFDDRLWRALADAGVLAATLPESVDGGGYGLLEQASVLRELGRWLGAVPYLVSIVGAAGTLAESGDDAQRALAGRAGTGDAILTVALAEEANPDPAQPATTAVSDGASWAVTGAKLAVPYATRAERLVVTATTPSGPALFLVDPAASGVTVTAQEVTDLSSAALVEFAGASAELVGSAELGAESVDRLLARTAVGLAALQLGTLERGLELVSAYARERTQFDRPIGSFQAVAQRLADAYIDVQGLRLTMWQAAWALAEGLPAEAEVRTAKFWAADAGHRVAHTMVHVHGGVGIDLDHIVQRYFTAAKYHEFALGSATDQLRALGELLATVPA